LPHEVPLMAEAQTVVVAPNCVDVSVQVSVKVWLSVVVNTPPSLEQDPDSKTVVGFPSAVETRVTVEPGPAMVVGLNTVLTMVWAGPTGLQEADFVTKSVTVEMSETVLIDP
jgi:hypothetical protein